MGNVDCADHHQQTLKFRVQRFEEEISGTRAMAPPPPPPSSGGGPHSSSFIIGSNTFEQVRQKILTPDAPGEPEKTAPMGE